MSSASGGGRPAVNREAGGDVSLVEVSDSPSSGRGVGHLLFYGAVTLLVAGSFLAEILRGGCPVP